MKQQRTRIVCTIGPVSHDVATLKEMIHAGMNICRLNFSHGTYSEHRALIKNIRKAAKETKTVVSILQDLSGPKMRVGDCGNGIELKKGERVVFGSRGGVNVIPVLYSYLERDLKVGNHILLDDGVMEVEVEKVRTRGVVCRVLAGGLLKSHKGFNLPGAELSISSITPKDKKDLKFGLQQKVDFVALSFVRNADDCVRLRRLIDEQWNTKHGCAPQIIAKIEKPEALLAIEHIIDAVDVIMIARGDLGIETRAATVPIEQKRIIQLCRQQGKPVIVATEMLGSMVVNPRPTRAEVSDVANAVIDKTDAVMLSGESASGAHPVEAVTMMSAIANETEQSMYDDVSLCDSLASPPHIERQVGEMISVVSGHRDIKAILIPPESIGVVAQISFFRPSAIILVGASDLRIARQTNMHWGVDVVPSACSSHAMYLKKIKKILRHLHINRVDRVAMIHLKGNSFELFVGESRELS